MAHGGDCVTVNTHMASQARWVTLTHFRYSKHETTANLSNILITDEKTCTANTVQTADLLTKTSGNMAK